jgi:hypothetical protein
MIYFTEIKKPPATGAQKSQPGKNTNRNTYCATLATSINHTNKYCVQGLTISDGHNALYPARQCGFREPHKSNALQKDTSYKGVRLTAISYITFPKFAAKSTTPSKSIKSNQISNQINNNSVKVAEDIDSLQILHRYRNPGYKTALINRRSTTKGLEPQESGTTPPNNKNRKGNHRTLLNHTTFPKFKDFRRPGIKDITSTNYSLNTTTRPTSFNLRKIWSPELIILPPAKNRNHNTYCATLATLINHTNKYCVQGHIISDSYNPLHPARRCDFREPHESKAIPKDKNRNVFRLTAISYITCPKFGAKTTTPSIQSNIFRLPELNKSQQRTTHKNKKSTYSTVPSNNQINNNSVQVAEEINSLQIVNRYRRSGYNTRLINQRSTTKGREPHESVTTISNDKNR